MEIEIMKYEEIEKQIAMKFEEIEKRVKERKEIECVLREQIDKKIKMLADGGFGKLESYKMLSGKTVDFRTLRRWHKGETMRTNTFYKLAGLIEEERKNERRT